jgi:hypothetical protein
VSAFSAAGCFGQVHRILLDGHAVLVKRLCSKGKCEPHELQVRLKEQMVALTAIETPTSALDIVTPDMSPILAAAAAEGDTPSFSNTSSSSVLLECGGMQTQPSIVTADGLATGYIVPNRLDAPEIREVLEQAVVTCNLQSRFLVVDAVPPTESPLSGPFPVLIDAWRHSVPLRSFPVIARVSSLEAAHSLEYTIETLCDAVPLHASVSQVRHLCARRFGGKSFPALAVYDVGSLSRPVAILPLQTFESFRSIASVAQVRCVGKCLVCS